MGPDGLPMGAPVGAVAMGGNVGMPFGAPGGAPAPMGGVGAPSERRFSLVHRFAWTLIAMNFRTQ